MKPGQAPSIVTAAARAHANGHEHCAEILEAIETMETVFLLAMAARERVMGQEEEK